MPVPQGQRSLDYEPQALRWAGPGRNGATRGYTASYGPHSCNGCQEMWTGSQAAHCAACHRTFCGLALFDAHRMLNGAHGGCRDPGERIAVFRDGMWRTPEMAAPGSDRGWRARHRR